MFITEKGLQKYAFQIFVFLYIYKFNQISTSPKHAPIQYITKRIPIHGNKFWSILSAMWPTDKGHCWGASIRGGIVTTQEPMVIATSTSQTALKRWQLKAFSYLTTIVLRFGKAVVPWKSWTRAALAQWQPDRTMAQWRHKGHCVLAPGPIGDAACRVLTLRDNAVAPVCRSRPRMKSYTGPGIDKSEMLEYVERCSVNDKQSLVKRATRAPPPEIKAPIRSAGAHFLAGPFLGPEIP